MECYHVFSFSFVAWKKLHTHLVATPTATIASRGLQ